MKTSTKNLAAALRVLAVEIQSPDGIANSVIVEVAERLEEQEALSRNLYEFMHEATRHRWMGKRWTPQQILEKGVELGLMVKKGKHVYAYSDELKEHFG